jgi:hypothetical protein
MSERWLDLLPLWGVLAVTAAGALLSVELGIWLGRARRRRAAHEPEASIAPLVAATLGLLAFMLAFTFGLAAARFEGRRQVVLDEANAIGTTWLRAELLPRESVEPARALLREYVDVRLAVAGTGRIDRAIARSEAIHRELWSLAASAAAHEPRSVAAGLVIESLNEVIDLHAKRVLVASRSRIPSVIFGALYLVAAMATLSIGYQAGLSDSRRSFAVVPLVVAFAAVLALITELDRPLVHQDLLKVSQQALSDVRASMEQR